MEIYQPCSAAEREKILPYHHPWNLEFDYLSIFLQVVFGMAIIFLFPMIVYVLTSLGILTPQLMKTYRRHAIVIIMIIAAIITPADVVSMFIAAIPLLLLYEMSVAMAQIIHKRLLKEQNLD